MKTIDLLVQELPALGGFPDGAVEAGFLCSNDTLYFVNKDGDCPSEWRISMKYDVEDRWVKVTREQYEAALAAKNEGWIAWGGGKCPLHHGAIVDVKLRNGRTEYAQKALSTEPYASYPFWRNDGTGGDIIAYRLHKPQEAEQPETSEEDLNECIGHDPVTEWNGDLLPPVGCECEYLDSNNEWYPVTIKYASNQIVVICGMTNIFGEEQETEIAKDIQLDKPKFRPLRSESDKKRDAAIEWFVSIMPTDEMSDTAAGYLYDAIAAGKVRGVKLEG